MKCMFSVFTFLLPFFVNNKFVLEFFLFIVFGVCVHVKLNIF